MKKQAIKIALQKESGHRTGACRFFGNPDLPDSLLEEEALFSTTEIFLGQLSFEQIQVTGSGQTASDETAMLPNHGMLYFFLEIGDMPYEAHVIYYGGEETLDEVEFNQDTEAELHADIAEGYTCVFEAATEETEGIRDDGGEAGLKLLGAPARLSWGYLDSGKRLLLQADLKELPDFLGRSGGYLYFIIDETALKEGRWEETLLQVELGQEKEE